MKYKCATKNTAFHNNHFHRVCVCVRACMPVYVNTGPNGPPGAPGAPGNQGPGAKGEKGEPGAPGKGLVISGRVTTL